MHALVPLAAECLWLCGAAGRLNWIGTGFSCPGPSWTPRGACMCLGTHSPTPLGFHPLTCVGLFRTAPCPVVWTRQCRSQAGKGFSEHPLTQSERLRQTKAVAQRGLGVSLPGLVLALLHLVLNMFPGVSQRHPVPAWLPSLGWAGSSWGQLRG